MTRPNPVCPGCGVEVVEISLSKTFIFVEGVRHSAGWQWIIPCCGAHLLDDEMEFTTGEHEADQYGDGMLESSLTDKAGNVVLSWLDINPEAEESNGY